MSTANIKHSPGSPTGVQSTFSTSGMNVEDIDRPSGDRRFRFLISADTGVENLSPETAASLGRWLLEQAAREVRS